MKTTLFLAALVSSWAAAASAEGFKSMARELGAPAKNARIQRVAVLPFVSIDGSSSSDGWGLSERLLTQLVRSGKVQTVERSLLKNVMDEHQFARTGAVDAALLKRLGRLFAADGIITGSYINIGRETSINARLIDVETGVIIAASERKVDREWFSMPGLGNREPRSKKMLVPAPEFLAEVPVIQDDVFPDLPDLKDSLADSPCAHAASRVDRLEGQILDIKARFWALKLRKGLNHRTITSNPGSTISDPQLKREFYDKMKDWYARKEIPELSPAEIRRFVTIDQQAHALYQSCGI